MDKCVVGGVELQNPLLNAAGTMGFGPSYADYIDLNLLGGLTTRTMTCRPRGGAPRPRLWETRAGALNRVGLQNPGYEKFVSTFYKGLAGLRVPVIASITGTEEEIGLMTRALCALERVKAIEVNLYCEPEEYYDMGREAYLERCRRQVAAAVAAGDRPVWAKLLPMAGDVVETAAVVRAAGGRCVVCANSYWAMALDSAGKSRLGSPTGGLTGPAIKPISLFLVQQVSQRVDIDVVGCGGVVTADDVREYLAAGAKAVAVGTANFTEPETIRQLIESL